MSQPRVAPPIPSKPAVPSRPQKLTTTPAPAPATAAAAPTTTAAAPPSSAPHVASLEEINAKKLAHRAKIAQEIFTTEQSYCASLTTLCELAIPALEQILTEDEIKLLFSNITTIATFNSNFCSELQKQTDSWGDESCIGKIFIEFVPFFRMYTQYVSNHDNAIAFNSELVQTSKYKRIEREIFSNPRFGNTTDLMHYLIMPIQRIPRYKLLLQEIIKYTPENHPDLEPCKSAHDLIADVATKVNNEIKQQQNRLLLIEKEKLLVLNESLVTPSRFFVRQGPMTKVCRSSDITYEFFLFNDLLIYASRNAIGKWKPHRMIPINASFAIQDVKDDNKAKNKFNIVNSSKSFAVYCSTPEEKREWFDDIAKCIHDVKKTIDIQKSANQFIVPVWQPDDQVDNCTICFKEFTIFNRRHHCRFCGAVVCGPCSRTRSVNPQNPDSQEKVRICDSCVKMKLKDDLKRSQERVEELAPEVSVSEDSILLRRREELELFKPGYHACVAEEDYSSNVEGDLSFTKGESIEVYFDVSTWWVGRILGDRSNGKPHRVGLFPGGLVKIDEEKDKGEILIKTRAIASCNVDSVGEMPPESGLIPYKRGDLLCITEDSTNEWFYAMNLSNDLIGYVPRASCLLMNFEVTQPEAVPGLPLSLPPTPNNASSSPVSADQQQQQHHETSSSSIQQPNIPIPEIPAIAPPPTPVSSPPPPTPKPAIPTSPPPPVSPRPPTTIPSSPPPMSSPPPPISSPSPTASSPVPTTTANVPAEAPSPSPAPSAAPPATQSSPAPPAPRLAIPKKTTLASNTLTPQQAQALKTHNINYGTASFRSSTNAPLGGGSGAPSGDKYPGKCTQCDCDSFRCTLVKKSHCVDCGHDAPAHGK